MGLLVVGVGVGRRVGIEAGCYEMYDYVFGVLSMIILYYVWMVGRGGLVWKARAAWCLGVYLQA